MSNTDNTGPLSQDSQIDEDRVRRALGLKTSGNQQHQQRPEQARQRHKFISDGAVPVVMLNRTDSETSGVRDRLVRAEAALESEKQAHAATRRALADARSALDTAQTRLQHALMAHRDAMAGEQDARRAAEDALEALRSKPEPEPAVEPVLAAIAEKAPRARAIRKVREAAPPKEQKPVRWWTPSYRAKNG